MDFVLFCLDTDLKPSSYLISSHLYAQLFSHVWLFETPWTRPCQAPLSMEFSKQEYWSGLLFPTSGALPDPGIELTSLASPTLVGRFFTTSTTWEALNHPMLCLTLCDPIDCNLPGSSVHEILQAKILEWVAKPSSQGSSWPRDWTHIACIGKWVLHH